MADHRWRLGSHRSDREPNGASPSQVAHACVDYRTAQGRFRFETGYRPLPGEPHTSGRLSHRNDDERPNLWFSVNEVSATYITTGECVTFMARKSYQEQLTELREDVCYMSEVVMERLRMGLDALERKDEALAQEVIEGDGEVNRMYLDLEQQCIGLLALQQPVASDLRFIASSFKIITDLERIGDLAVNLGDYTKASERDLFPDVDVQAMGELTLEMVDDAMQAYDTGDVDACRELAVRDDDLDHFAERASEIVVRDLIERELESPDEVEILLQDVSRLLLTIRDLERVGDHAVNIAARTLYMIENDDELIY